MCSAWPETRIETLRLRLRPLRTDDASRLAALADDPRISRMTAGLPSPYTRADAEAFLLAQADPLSPEHTFAVDVRGEGLAGVLGFRPRPGCAWPELGYWLGRPFWGAGLATEAVDAALGWARARGRRAVAAGHFADNPASGRVLEKAGFLYTGDREPCASVARGGPAESRRMIWLA